MHPRIEEWRTWQQAQGLSARTVDARCWRLHDFAQWLADDPSTATADHIVHYMALLSKRNHRGKPMTKSSLATYHSHLKAFFAWLVKVEARDDNPIERVPAPKVAKRQPRPVSDRELKEILRTPMHRRTRMMILLAAFEGLRVHEIAKIRGEDVNILDGRLRVTGKGEVTANLPLHPIVAAEAEDYPRKGYWFPTNRAGNTHGALGPVLARSVSDIISEVFDRAGVDGGAHRLRHWYGTMLLNKGANMRTVQSLLRHASLETTQLYTDVNVTDQKAAIESLSMPDPDDGESEAA